MTVSSCDDRPFRAAAATPSFRDGLVASLPALQAFALKLAGNPALAEDLVQDTMVKALRHGASFRPGTNQMAWLITILRNTFFTGLRRRRLEIMAPESLHALLRPDPAVQEDRRLLGEVVLACRSLSDPQRDALFLVGAAGLTYGEAAATAGCAVGTMKSRVNRARAQLLDSLDHAQDRKDLGNKLAVLDVAEAATT